MSKNEAEKNIDPTLAGRHSKLSMVTSADLELGTNTSFYGQSSARRSGCRTAVIQEPAPSMQIAANHSSTPVFSLGAEPKS
jgi:hypothetical protein